MRRLLFAAFTLPLLSCQTVEPPRQVTLLTLNDVYRIEGVEGGRVGGLARFKALRDQLAAEDPDLLVLHAGDFLFPSLLSRQYDGAQMIDVMNQLDGAPEGFDDRLFVTFGNHEFDKSAMKHAALLDARIEESQFLWLGSNVVFAPGEDGLPRVAAENLVTHTMVEANGITVGLFSLTTDVKHPDYVAAFTDVMEVARAETATLRAAGADLVIALTHQSVDEDAAVLMNLADAGPDLIVGGHEHQRQLVEVAGRSIVKADADLRSAAVISVTLTAGALPQVAVTFREPSDEAPAPDAAVAAKVTDWLVQHDKEYCEASYKLPPGCLDEPLGKTSVALIAEELEIRRFETNLGNWVLDQALAAFTSQGAEIAFLNAGSLRLNQDIAAGTQLTRRHLDELFAYPNELRLIKISGATLQQVVERAVTDWEGNGWWLQVAGFAFTFDPASGQVGHLTLLTPQGPRVIKPEDELLAVTNDFLMEPKFGQDGYSMLTPEMLVPQAAVLPSLRDLVLQALIDAGAKGIAPTLEGRICNSERPGPCLAILEPGS